MTLFFCAPIVVPFLLIDEFLGAMSVDRLLIQQLLSEVILEDRAV